MTVFRAIVFSSIVAGILVGLFVTVAHQFGTVPLILQSEVYETAAEPPTATHNHDNATAPATHEHGAASWAPADGWQRGFFTAAADILTAIGFAMLLTSAYVLAGRTMTWREGLFWGMAGFAVFTLAPGLGLPPELPGMPVADLEQRQVWWVAAAAATAAGIGLMAFHRSLWAAVLAVALIVAPHLIGAPLAPESASHVPLALWHQFVVAVTVTSFVSWLLLGGLTGALHRRFMRQD